MADNPRIDELRRRVDKDPASIAFAQLAEECRRAGENDDAIRICRAGLEQHPGYLSARVTLGRALLETGQFDEAQSELEQVVRAAPDNLAAIRALSDIHQRRDEGGLPASAHKAAELLPDIPPLPDPDLAFSGSHDRFAEALKTLGGEAPVAVPDEDVELPHEDVEPAREEIEPVPLTQAASSALPPPSPPDPAIAELEKWLRAILADRSARRAS
jgi:tetratricopeptide (TPR) repeat protein